jgi:hypothetical protein
MNLAKRWKKRGNFRKCLIIVGFCFSVPGRLTGNKKGDCPTHRIVAI